MSAGFSLGERVEGIHVRESVTQSQRITGVVTDATAFVGRCLRGPINEAVSLKSFAEFERQFGGLWQASPLSYALCQFFQNGGRQAIVVRVARGARPSQIALPAGDESLRLLALSPGAQEYLRAAVDYDGLADAAGRFNLTVQRLRHHAGQHIRAQEVFRAVSLDPLDERFLPDMMRRACIATPAFPLPAQPPDATGDQGEGPHRGYVCNDLSGYDGESLTDRDLLGSGSVGSGLFALRGAPDFGLLYLPSPAPDTEVGVVLLRAAARVCQREHAILLVDPPRAWKSPDEALAALQTYNALSTNSAMYFPRLWLTDPLNRRRREFPPGGAVAGVIAAGDGEHGVWRVPAGRDACLQGVRALAQNVGERDNFRLSNAGVNCIRQLAGGRKVLWDARTLVEASAGGPWTSLRVCRLANYLKKSIRRGTHWAAFERNDPRLWELLIEQIEDFLNSVWRAGGLRGTTPGAAYFVRCDDTTTSATDRRTGSVNIKIGFAPLAPNRFVEFEIRKQTLVA